MKIVQIGANVGRDEIAWDFITKHRAWGLLVEPNPAAMAVLKKTYKNFAANIVYDTVAISHQRGKASFFIPDDNPCSEHASLDGEFLPSAGHAIEVECITLEDLFLKHKIHKTVIDFLITDTEGSDGQILLSTDFSKLHIKKIVFEHIHLVGYNHTGETFWKVIKHLSDFGYRDFQVRDKRNTFAEKTR